MRTLGIITNPTSGSGRGARRGAEAKAALAAGGHHLVDLSRGSWAASYEAAMARRDELDALVVVGGDGMAHLGLQVCAEHSLPLGIIAAGSGDDIAMAVGLPRHDIPASVRRIEEGLRGLTANLDLGKVDGDAIEEPCRPRYFGAVLSAGLDAAVASYARAITFPRGPLKYKVATMREVPRFRPYGVRISADGREWTQTCTLVAVANARIFGGGLVISPESHVADGRLELVTADAMGKRDIARLFAKLKDGSHVTDPLLRIQQVDKVSIVPDPSGAPLPPAFADGELVGAMPLTVSIARAAVTVLGGRAQ
ncbi:diacylglycerol/lipid kinase family protein [Demequina mangrovi]|uniref:Diacylglycerol kinase n=1 Tax=Demequina mangrovi TaxID=1043493 RepID=A0A1H6UBI5_9MICO|nr:diacylglycerol kinase family protein [Demequina mangrovi]SEI85212.1 diacylglycerol kinase [Demequina mangrovi]